MSMHCLLEHTSQSYFTVFFFQNDKNPIFSVDSQNIQHQISNQDCIECPQIAIHTIIIMHQ